MAGSYFTPGQLSYDGTPTWLTAMAGEEQDPSHLVHVVRDLGPVEALEVLGVKRQDIQPCVLPPREPADQYSLARAAIHPLNPIVVLIAARVGQWTLIYDDLGETGFLWHLEQEPVTSAALSAAGSVAACASVAMTGLLGFTYAADGNVLFEHDDFDDFRPEDLEYAPPQVRAAAEAAGTVEAEFDQGITMRMICALAELPRTLDDLRGISLLVAPLQSRPELFGQV